MIVDYLFIMFCVVIITDYSDLTDSIKDAIQRFINKPVKLPKIMVCSFCQTFWCCLLYTICLRQLSIANIGTILLVCCFTDIFLNVLLTTRDLLIWCLRGVDDFFNK